jgi:hypothetical protein
LQAILAGKHDHPGKTVHGTQISVHLPKPQSPRTPIRSPLDMAKDFGMSSRDLNINPASDLDEPSEEPTAAHGMVARAYSRFSPSQTPSAMPHFSAYNGGTPHHNRESRRTLRQHESGGNGHNGNDVPDTPIPMNNGTSAPQSSPIGGASPSLDLVLSPLTSASRGSNGSGPPLSSSTQTTIHRGGSSGPGSPLFVASPRWGQPPLLSTVDEKNRRRTSQNIASVLEEKNRRRTADIERRRTDRRITPVNTPISTAFGLASPSTMERHNIHNTMTGNTTTTNTPLPSPPSGGNALLIGSGGLGDDRAAFVAAINRRRTAESGALTVNRLLTSTALQPRRLLDINVEAQLTQSQNVINNMSSPSSSAGPMATSPNNTNISHNFNALPPASSPSSTSSTLPQGSPTSTTGNAILGGSTGHFRTESRERNELAIAHSLPSPNTNKYDHKDSSMAPNSSSSSGSYVYGSGNNSSTISIGPIVPPSTPIVSAIFPSMRLSAGGASIVSIPRLPDLPMGTIISPAPLAGDGHQSPEALISSSSSTSYSSGSGNTFASSNHSSNTNGGVFVTPFLPPFTNTSNINGSTGNVGQPITQRLPSTRASLRVASPPSLNRDQTGGCTSAAALHASVTAEERWRSPPAGTTLAALNAITSSSSSATAIAAASGGGGHNKDNSIISTATTVTTSSTSTILPASLSHQASPRTPTIPYTTSGGSGSVGSSTTGAGLELSPPLLAQTSPASTPTPPDMALRQPSHGVTALNLAHNAYGPDAATVAPVISSRSRTSPPT